MEEKIALQGVEVNQPIKLFFIEIEIIRADWLLYFAAECVFKFKFLLATVKKPKFIYNFK